MKSLFFSTFLFLVFSSHAVTNSVVIDGDVDAVGDWDDEICLPDLEGQNDVMGQSDANNACIASNFASVQPANTIYLRFDFDETGLNGGNTADGCWLLDNDTDGNANLALCFSLGGNPFTLDSADVKGYTCNDANADKCSGPTEITPFVATCLLDVTATNVFDNTDDDASVECSVPISTLGLTAGDQVSLTYGCTFNSAIPNSNPVDCVNDSGNPFNVDTGTGGNSTPVELMFFKVE